MSCPEPCAAVPHMALDPITTIPLESLVEEPLVKEDRSKREGSKNGDFVREDKDDPIPLLPYNVLAHFNSFQSKHQEAWWNAIIPSVVGALNMAEYSVSAQYDCVRFVRDHILPHLDIPPSEDDASPWKSTLHPLRIPVQLNVTRQNSGATVQLTFEPISSLAGSTSDAYNRTAIAEAVESLASTNLTIDTHWFYILKDELTLSDLEAVSLTPSEIEYEQKSQAYLSLNFGLESSEDSTLECYFSPLLKSKATGSPVEQLIFNAIRKIDVHGQFTDSLLVVQRYLSAYNRDTRDAVLLGFDMACPEKSSITIHFVDWQLDFTTITELFTLNGERGSAEVISGINHMKRLWEDLSIIEGNRDDSSKPGFPFAFSFELSPRAPEPKLRVYFPVHELFDDIVATAIEQLYSDLEWSYKVKGLYCLFALKRYVIHQLRYTDEIAYWLRNLPATPTIFQSPLRTSTLGYLTLPAPFTAPPWALIITQCATTVQTRH